MYKLFTRCVVYQNKVKAKRNLGEKHRPSPKPYHTDVRGFLGDINLTCTDCLRYPMH